MAPARRTAENTTPPTPAQDSTPDGAGEDAPELDMAATLADLVARVENLERHTAAPTPEEAELAQVARDRDLLSRAATSYEEAVAQEAARQRQADRARRPIGDGG